MRKLLREYVRGVISELLHGDDSSRYSYFHISKRDLGDEFTFTPRLPSEPFSDANGTYIEDSITKRTSWAPSVEAALWALGSTRFLGYVYAVHDLPDQERPADADCPSGPEGNSYGPNFTWKKYERSLDRTISRDEREGMLKGCVPDAQSTGEVWNLSPVTAKRIGIVDGGRFLKEASAWPDYSAPSPWASMRGVKSSHRMNASARFGDPSGPPTTNIDPADMTAQDSPWGELDEDDCDLDESGFAPWGSEGGASGGSPSLAMSRQNDLNVADPPGRDGADEEEEWLTNHERLPGKDARDVLDPSESLDEACYAGSQPEEAYDMDEDALMLDEPGTIVEPDVRHSIKRYFKAMGLAPKSSKRSRG